MISYNFLSDRYLLIAQDPADDPTVISIIDMQGINPATCVKSVAELDVICRLLLPAKSGPVLASIIHMDARSVQQEYRDKDFRVPFHLSDAELFSLTAVYLVENGREGCTFLIPSSTFWQCIQIAGGKYREFAWDEWGPPNTHILRTDPETMVYSVSGMTLMTQNRSDLVPPGSSSRVHVELWDFTQLAARKHQTDASRGIETPGTRLCDSSSYGESKVFKCQNIRTTLLSRVTDVSIEVVPGRVIRDISLLEDSIEVAYKVRAAEIHAASITDYGEGR